MPSKPSRLLVHNKLTVGDVLDYGCGKGRDADAFGWDKFDPYFHNVELTKQYDTIVCNYVLNVVPLDEEKEVLKKISDALKPNGKAYLSVRMDEFDAKSLHRFVFLPFKIIHKEKSFCIYLMHKNE
jgi:ATP adenylyltransferase